MFGIFDKIEEFFKDLLLGGIQANLESMFLDINDKVCDCNGCGKDTDGVEWTGF